VSSNTPPNPAAGDPEYLASDSAGGASNASGSGRKLGVLGGAAVGVAAVIGLGGWGAYALLAGGGSQPSEVIPASAVGYLSLDLDPSAAQKIEALQILKKFPGIEKELDIGDRDDLRRWVFEMMQDDGVCENLDYGDDVEPWIGDRVAVAAVPGDEDEVTPLVALQVTDQDAAATGVEALADCSEADEADFGYAFTGDYVLLTESTSLAESSAGEAERAPLADDAKFQEWTDAVGDSGIVTMYASAEAPGYLMGLQNDFMGGTDDVAFESDVAAESELRATTGDLDEQMKEMYKDFDGMAGVVRFEDGAVEMEFAGKGVPTGFPGTGGESESGVTTLPASTGAALSMTLSEGWLTKYLDQMSSMFGAGGLDLEEGLAELERETGLAVPEDVETLLGDSVALAVDADINFEAVSQSQDPSELPAGIKVHGDPDQILPIVDKIKASIGPEADLLVVESDEDSVAFGFDKDYVGTLVGEGELGDEGSFQNVVPNADDATSVFYLNFDAGDGWAAQFADFVGGGDPEVMDNLEPLDAVGMSSWVDDEVQHGLLRLTTD